MKGDIVYSRFFFFKQKTAYEIRISDWSSDVCSSDLPGQPAQIPLRAGKGALRVLPGGAADRERVQLQFELPAKKWVVEPLAVIDNRQRDRLLALNVVDAQRLGDRKSTRLNSSH